MTAIQAQFLKRQNDEPCRCMLVWHRTTIARSQRYQSACRQRIVRAGTHQHALRRRSTLPRILTAIVAMAALLTIAFPAVASAWGGDAADCDDFDAWQWAQTVFETDPDDHATLDPNDDGIACPSLPRNGFAPVLWTDAIPASAERARIASVTDGDTFDIIVNGTPDTVRMYHINSRSSAARTVPNSAARWRRPAT